MNHENDEFAKIKKHMEEMLDEIKLRAEFEFEEVWKEMQRDPILSAMIDPRLMLQAKKIMKHGFLSGAQTGIVVMLEKIANDICE